MKRLLHVFGSLAILFATANGYAAMVSLSSLVAGDTITSGDKVFDDWTILGNDLCPAPGPDCGEINLDDIMVENVGDGTVGNEYGLQFTATNGALTQIGDSFLDLFFGFSVTVMDPAMEIVGSSMVADVDIGVDSEWIYAEKDIFDSNQDSLAFMSIESDSLLMFEDLDASAAFAGQSQIWVEDNIYIDGLDGSAELISLTQRFIQAPVAAVPAPGTLALLALGLLGAGFARRR